MQSVSPLLKGDETRLNNAHQAAEQSCQIWSKSRGMIADHRPKTPKLDDSFRSKAPTKHILLSRLLLKINCFIARGDYLGKFLLGMCHWPLKAPTPL